MNMLNENKIANINLEMPIFLAPLAGYTNSPYRRIVKSFGAGLVFTEMVSVMGIRYKDKKTLELLKFHESERPIFAQLFGNDVESFVLAAKFVESLGFDGIDINAGCPVAKIVKEGSGSALLKDLPKLQKIVESVKKSVSKPISLKVRKGFFKGENVLKDVVKIAYETGIDFLTIHSITQEEGFKDDAEDWLSLAEAVSISKVPIVANGGIKSEEDVKKILEITKAPFVMVGRASIGRPWFLKSAFDFLTKNTKISIPNKEKIDIIVRHIELEVEFSGEKTGIIEMRKFLQAYAYGMKNAANFRQKVNNIKTKDETIALVRAFFNV